MTSKHTLRIVGAFLFLTIAGLSSGIQAQSYNINDVDGQTISTCSGFLYDSGGPLGYYSPSDSYSVTICSDSSDPIHLGFLQFILEEDASCQWDSLTIYNGTDNTAPKIGTYCGLNSPGLVSSTNASNCLHLEFGSDTDYEYHGFAAEIFCGSNTPTTTCSNSYSICGVDFDYVETVEGGGVLTASNFPNTYTLSFLEVNMDGKWIPFYECFDATQCGNSPSTFIMGAASKTYTFRTTFYTTDDYNPIGSCQKFMQMDFGCPTISIDRVTVSNCYISGGQSKATVEAEVSWYAANGSDIDVNIGGSTRSISTGNNTYYLGDTDPWFAAPPYPVNATLDIVSPQIIALELDADGSSGSITAEFADDNTINDTDSYTLPTQCPPELCTGTELGGMAFVDYDNNGIKSFGETLGAEGITVTAYAPDGTVYGPVVTDEFGLYEFPLAPADYPVRVEFSNIPNLYHSGHSSFNGADGRTSVQFVEAPDCNVDLGVNLPEDYCQETPEIIVACYVNGDPLAGGTSATQPAIVAFPYNSSGDPAPKTFMIEGQYVGTTWANAFSKRTRQLFSAAQIRRHAGLGPGGLDAIYITDLTDFTNPVLPPQQINVGPMGVNVGTMPTNAARGLPPDTNVPNYDIPGWENMGYVGIGGISLSTNEDTLWLVSVYDNSLHALNLSTFNTSGNAGDISYIAGYNIPDIGCVDGEQRSWACRYHKGVVYVGSICNGLKGNRSDLRASVHSFAPGSGTFTEIYNIPLSYPKGPAIAVSGDGAATHSTGWFPWTNQFLSEGAYPQAILSDIDFDIDGSMVLGFLDRYGMMTGYQNYIPDENETDTYLWDGVASGDILRAYKTNDTYILENNAYIPGITGYGPDNYQGPGLGEYFNDDIVWNGNLAHSESAIGGLLIKPGSGEVITTAIDPITDPQTALQVHNSGGVRRFNNQTGQIIDAYQVYTTPDDPGVDPTFSKAAGLGDICLNCDIPKFMQIGNRVWLDNDELGEQDANEMDSLENINVRLYKIAAGSASLIAEATTNAEGEFFFTESGENFDTLETNTTYKLVFGETGQFDTNTGLLTLNGVTYRLTSTDTGEGSLPDLNDNDAYLETDAAFAFEGYPVIDVTTGLEGYVDHTLDIGLRLACSMSESHTASCMDNSTPADGSDDYIQLEVTGTVLDGSGSYVVKIGAYTSAATTSGNTITIDGDGLSGNPDMPADGTSTYTVRVEDSTNPDCFEEFTVGPLSCFSCAITVDNSVTPTACDPADNTYDLDVTVTYTNEPAGDITITVNGTDYTFTPNGSGNETFTIAGLDSDGTQDIDVTATFVADNTCTHTLAAAYDAPESCNCPPVNCIPITITKD